MRMLVAACVAIVALTSSTARADDTQTKILLIGKERDHPPQTHEYMAECAMLAKCLKQTPGVEAVVSDGWPSDPAVFDGVDAVVLYTAQGGNLMFGREHRDQAEKLMAKGVGLVALHWGTGADDEAGPRQLEHLGAWFNTAFSQIPVRDSTIRPADPTHPVCRGWSDTPMKDEYYIKLRYRPEARPVVMARIDGEDYPVGWVFERPGGGRSFGYVCGHFHDCFRLAPFRRSVVNGILWAAGHEVPEGGAPVEVSPDDLVLPPDPRVEAAKKK